MTTTTLVDAHSDYFSFYESDTIFGNVLSNDAPYVWGTQLNYLDHQLINGKRAGAITDVAGEFGIFHVKLDGSFTYTLNEDAKAALLPGQTLTENLMYKMSDGGGAYGRCLAQTGYQRACRPCG
ncbi:VCBS repeat-containing protein [Rhizobium sp. BK529]|uniref:VCBS domain-containing protein n=1 Tax=Rhizobium sp. BK529 TaxID=2586983 RepID=UPI00179A36B1|nr:VCBS domain-containing protein [Rhizobium sp. BK529]MBB3591741.1 VCBS repeat-containing protein [Rhizobium sp. BK529]